MKRKIAVFLVIIVCFILQSTVFQALSLGGIVPNLLIVITSSFGFMRGKKEGMIIGFVCGLLVDIFFGEVLCFYAFIYMNIGYLNGFFRKIFYPEDIKLPMLLITASDFLYCMVSYIFLFLLRSRMDFTFYFVHIILPEIVYTVVVTLGLYRVLLLINQKLEGVEKRSASKFV